MAFVGDPDFLVSEWFVAAFESRELIGIDGFEQVEVVRGAAGFAWFFPQFSTDRCRVNRSLRLW